MRGSKRCKTGYGEKLLYAGLILLVLTLITSALVSKVLARYAVSNSRIESARVAMMHIGGDVFSVDLSDIVKPGDYKEVELHIYGKAEVSLRYRFGIEIDGSMPIICKITKEANQSQTGTNEEGTTTTLLTSSIQELDSAIRSQALGDEDAMPLRKLGTIEPVSSTQGVPESVPPNTDLEEYTQGYTYMLRVEWPIEENNLEYPYARSFLTIGLYAEQVD